MCENKRIIIVHGYTSSPERNWFPWLKASLEARGCSVDVPRLPDSSQPRLEAWLACLAEHLQKIDGRTFIVAHSLGCIALLGALQRLVAETRFGGMILVAGFNRPVGGLAELDEFATQPIDYARVAAMPGRCEAIAAKDDPIVPAEVTRLLAGDLSAEFLLTDHGGHFMDSDGFQEWPFLFDRVKDMMAASSCPRGR